jgi:hypothetical protein
LPPINNFIFSTLFPFKYKRNLARIHQYLLKHYSFTVEETAANPQTLGRYKTVQREDILNYARAKGYITEEELAPALAAGSNVPEVMRVLGGSERYVEIFAKTTVDIIMSHEVTAKRAKRDAGGVVDENSHEAELSIWLKDFP